MMPQASPEIVSPRHLSTRTLNQSAEWLALLECVAPTPNLDRFADLVQNSFNWLLLLQHAEEHGVLSFLGKRLKNLNPALAPPEAGARLRELQRVQTFLALQLTAELFRVQEHFAKTGIAILVTKGPALALRCYGDPGMRQYVDLDLVICENDIRRATELMLELGYHPRVPLSTIDANKTPGEYSFVRSDTGLIVEFHAERTFRYHPRPLDIEKLFQRSTSLIIDDRKVPVLSLEDELVLICVHGAKHFWERLLWIADVAALISRQPLDWDLALAVANEVGAQRILRLGLRLAADLLGANLPSQIEASVRADRAVAKLATQIENRLVHPAFHKIGILQRAAFRVQMRDSLLPGLAYLLRLSLSPTEEDWAPGKEGNRSAFIDVIRRPFRLARKHSHGSGK